MSTSQANRITRELTPEQQERLKRQRELIAKELPDLCSAIRWPKRLRKSRP